jgi:hypothetical protein
MFSTEVFYLFIASLVIILFSVNGWAIYRGLLYNAEIKVPGLQLHHGALAFTDSLIGLYQGSALDSSFQMDPYIFSYSVFPTPNTNILEYNGVFSQLTDKYTYVTRCLVLGTDEIPTNFSFYGYTVMYSNGTGIGGNICQQEYDDPGAYGQMDTLCGNQLACMRNGLLLGCVFNSSFSRHFENNCGRTNMKKKGLHWSGTGKLCLDSDAGKLTPSPKPPPPPLLTPPPPPPSSSF